MDFAPGLVKVTLRPRPGLHSQGLVHVVSFSSGHSSLFPSPSLCFKWGWETPHALPGQGIEAVCGSLQGLEKIPPVIDLFWCWSPRACHVKAEDFSLGERCYFAGLWGSGNSNSPLSLRAHSTRGVASSQALFRGVPLEDICVAAGWSSPHTFVRFYNLDVWYGSRFSGPVCLNRPYVVGSLLGQIGSVFSLACWYIVPDALS